MSNELKLSLENFQSIANGELVFKTGTNAIVGQSNSGKTATFRALKACLINPSGSQRFIKKRTKETRVTLSYSNNQIEWRKSKDENSYVINGEEYLKTGRSNAFKLLENTGFVLDCDDTIMNIEEELQLPFPFGISKGDLFKLFENVFCVSDSAVIMKTAKTFEATTKSDIENLEMEVIKNKKKLEELQEFKKFIDLEEMSRVKDVLVSYNNRLILLKDNLPSIKRTHKVLNLQIPEMSFNNSLQKYRELRDLKDTMNKIRALHKVSKALNEYEISNERLSEYRELQRLRELYESISNLEKLQVESITFKNNLDKYKELLELKGIGTTLESIKSLKIPQANFTDRVQTLSELKSYKTSLLILRDKVIEKKRKQKEIVERVEELESKIKEVKVCPLCHKEL